MRKSIPQAVNREAKLTEKLSVVLIAILLFLAIGTPAIMSFRSLANTNDEFRGHSVTEAEVDIVMKDIFGDNS